MAVREGLVAHRKKLSQGSFLTAVISNDITI